MKSALRGNVAINLIAIILIMATFALVVVPKIHHEYRVAMADYAIDYAGSLAQREWDAADYNDLEQPSDDPPVTQVTEGADELPPLPECTSPF